MKWYIWLIIGIIVLVVIVAVYMIISTTKKSVLQEQAELEREMQITKKLDNAPESRAELQQLIAVTRIEMKPFTGALSVPEIKRRGLYVGKLPPSPLPSLGEKVTGGWSYSWAEIEQIVDYYNLLISGYQTQFNALL